MFAKLNYDAKFDKILEEIANNYGEEIFDLEGIGKQLDISEYGKKFFSNSENVADESVDANANVDDVTVVAYENESVKPLFRLNSLYLLWKELTKLYGEQFAKDAVESQILGDFYINDLSGVQKPYSYHKDTIINVKINNTWSILSMEDLFNRYKDKVNILDDREEIYLGDLDIEVYDEDKSTKLLYVLRHKNHTALKKIETKHGEVTIVTDDHPIILEASTEILARDLNIGDRIKLGCPLSPTGNYSDIDLGYFLGFFVGDGQVFIKDRGRYITTSDYEKGNFESITSGGIIIHQKDIKNSKIFNVCKKLFGDKYTIKEDRQLIYNDVNLALRFLDTKLGSRNRILPSDILKYDRDTLLNIVAGIIDSEGTVGENGMVTIRVTSYSLAQQIGELLRILGIGKVRVSIVNNTPQSKHSYKSNYDLYRIGLRLKSFDIVPYSVKLQNTKSIYKEVGKDGRFETSEVLKIDYYDYSSEYVYDITTTTGHFYSQGMIQHNCYNFSAYDVMTKGLPFVKKVDSKPPKYLSSFCGQMVHFTAYASNQVLGAVGVADLLIVMSYYVKKELELLPSNPEYVWRQVKQEIQSLIYSMNQPFRGGLQSGFYNISIYDREFLESLKDDYIFPDGSTPDIELVQQLQDLFVDIMNEELTRTTPTFPVTTLCLCVDENNNIKDQEFLRHMSEKNMKFAFMNIYAGTTGTLSSCCRLRSNKENQYIGYTNSFGGASTQIGSFGVVTLNLPRAAHDSFGNVEEFLTRLEQLVNMSVKINNAKRELIKKRIAVHALPLYDYGFMNLQKQYATTGLNGINEAVEILGYDILTKEGQDIVLKILNLVNSINDKYDEEMKYAHNCEQTPSESSAIKAAAKDHFIGINLEYDLYSNQFIPLITQADMLDRIKLQGLFDSHFSGGAIAHLNVEQQIEDVDQLVDLINSTVKMGVVYHAVNYMLQKCEHGHMTVGKRDTCPICNSKITDNYTRIVGFLVNTKNAHKVRREIDIPNRQFYKNI